MVRICIWSVGWMAQTVWPMQRTLTINTLPVKAKRLRHILTKFLYGMLYDAFEEIDKMKQVSNRIAHWKKTTGKTKWERRGFETDSPVRTRPKKKGLSMWNILWKTPSKSFEWGEPVTVLRVVNLPIGCYRFTGTPHLFITPNFDNKLRPYREWWRFALLSYGGIIPDKRSRLYSNHALQP